MRAAERRRRTQSTLKIGGRCASPAASPPRALAASPPRAPHYLYKILKTRRPALRALIARAHSIAVPLPPPSVIKLASPRLVAPPTAARGGGRARRGGGGARASGGTPPPAAQCAGDRRQRRRARSPRHERTNNTYIVPH